ncbi:hypothetical protein SCHPADRAFT_933222 [Schizopora paradoxa]|uniref:Uncharacterized protein n=1 Tax=Schizopora paradoxa TaxID=27342 RepID=A0A0H2R4B4_9AGAM|nr:hypothetical protein SCHPADRAFT_933222 [Schizopora paradoxa]
MPVALKRTHSSPSSSDTLLPSPGPHKLARVQSSSKDLKENMSSRVQAVSKMYMEAGRVQPKELRRESAIHTFVQRIPLSRNCVNEGGKSSRPLPPLPTLPATSSMPSFGTAASSLAGPPPSPATDVSANVASSILRRPVGGLKRSNASCNLLDLVSSGSNVNASSAPPPPKKEEKFNFEEAVKKLKSAKPISPSLMNDRPSARSPPAPPIISRRFLPPSPLCDASFKPQEVDMMQQRVTLHRRGMFVPPRPPIDMLLAKSESIRHRRLFLEPSHSLASIYLDAFGPSTTSLWQASPYLKTAVSTSAKAFEGTRVVFDDKYPLYMNYDSDAEIARMIDEDIARNRAEYFDNAPFFSASSNEQQPPSNSTSTGTYSSDDDDDFILLDSPGAKKLEPLLPPPRRFEPDSDGEDEMYDDDDGWIGFTARPSSRLGVSPPSSPSHSRFRRVEEPEDIYLPESPTTVDTFELD